MARKFKGGRRTLLFTYPYPYAFRWGGFRGGEDNNNKNAKESRPKTPGAKKCCHQSRGSDTDMAEPRQRLVQGTKSDEEAPLEPEDPTLTKQQCKALADAKEKDKVFRLLCLSAMVDTAGSSLLSPAYAMAVSNAPGSVPPQGGVHPDAFPTVPVPFSLATNIILSSMVLGGVFSGGSATPVEEACMRAAAYLEAVCEVTRSFQLQAA